MTPLPARDALIPASAVIGWSAMFIHNLAELPGQPVLSPESLVPFWSPLLATAWMRAFRRVETIGLPSRGMLHLVGGGIPSVRLLPALPLAPEQSPSPCFPHAIHSLAQPPLVYATSRRLRVQYRNETPTFSPETP